MVILFGIRSMQRYKIRILTQSFNADKVSMVFLLDISIFEQIVTQNFHAKAMCNSNGLHTNRTDPDNTNRFAEKFDAFVLSVITTVFNFLNCKMNFSNQI